MKNNDVRTKAFVLRRTNYGEADRIVNFLTPLGKISAIAKGVRREKSKLAGNIEMFCLSEITVHHSQKSDLGILTSARMQKSYSNIITDLSALELASQILKLINRVSEDVKNAVFFDLVQQSFEAINNGVDLQLIKLWFKLNLAQATGTPINFYRDVNGDKLKSDQKYFWDEVENALRPDPQGNLSANEIKLARLLVTNKLATATRVQNITEFLPALAVIAG